MQMLDRSSANRVYIIDGRTNSLLPNDLPQKIDIEFRLA